MATATGLPGRTGSLSATQPAGWLRPGSRRARNRSSRPPAGRARRSRSPARRRRRLPPSRWPGLAGTGPSGRGARCRAAVRPERASPPWPPAGIPPPARRRPGFRGRGAGRRPAGRPAGRLARRWRSSRPGRAAALAVRSGPACPAGPCRWPRTASPAPRRACPRPGHELADQVGPAVLQPGIQDPGGAERRYPAGRPRFRREPVPGGAVGRPLAGEQGDGNPVAVGRPAEVRGGARRPEDAPGQPVAPDALGIVGTQWRDLRHASSPRGPAWQDVRFVPYALCAGVLCRSSKFLAGEALRYASSRGQTVSRRRHEPPAAACYVWPAPGRDRIRRRNRAQLRRPERYIRARRMTWRGMAQMATDYDSPRKTDDELTEDSLQELQARRMDKSSSTIDVDPDDVAESLELPGADLSNEELSFRVIPRQADEFTCSSCFLVHHRSQLAETRGKLLVCRECAA